MAKVTVTIKKDGTMEYLVAGVKGKGCKDLTKFLDRMGEVLESKNTAEYNQAPDNEQERIKN
jgi:hypothetical protein